MPIPPAAHYNRIYSSDNFTQERACRHLDKVRVAAGAGVPGQVVAGPQQGEQLRVVRQQVAPQGRLGRGGYTGCSYKV